MLASLRHVLATSVCFHASTEAESHLSLNV